MLANEKGEKKQNKTKNELMYPMTAKVWMLHKMMTAMLDKDSRRNLYSLKKVLFLGLFVFFVSML